MKTYHVKKPVSAFLWLASIGALTGFCITTNLAVLTISMCFLGLSFLSLSDFEMNL